MSTAIYHHLSVETEVHIGVSRPHTGGSGFVLTADAGEAGAQLTVFLTREQLLALHAAAAIALSEPAKILHIGSERNGSGH